MRTTLLPLALCWAVGTPLSAFAQEPCQGAGAKTFDALLHSLEAKVPEHGVRAIPASDVAGSLALAGEPARRFTSLVRACAIDAEGHLELDLARPFSFVSGDVGLELGTHVEARLGHEALQGIRGVKADGKSVDTATRAYDPHKGPGIQVHGRGFMGISGSRFLPLDDS